MSALAVYLAGLCDYKDKLVRGEKGVVLLLAPDMRQAKVSLDYAAGVLESTPIMRQLLGARTADAISSRICVGLRKRSPDRTGGG